MNEYAALIGRMREALNDLDRVVNRIEMLMEKALQTNDDGYVDAVALNLHGFYAGVEHIFKDIAQTLNEMLPDGYDWHQKLLLQMSADLPSVRPPVIQTATRDCLDEYRGFRHIVRNVYTFNLRMSRVQELTGEVRDCFTAVSQDLDQFAQFLQQLPRE